MPRVRKREQVDVREAIVTAFHTLGGRDYLVKLAKTRPELFLPLLAKIVPKEIHASFTARYEPLPVRVEARNAIAGPEGSAAPALPAPEIVDAEVIEPEQPAKSDSSRELKAKAKPADPQARARAQAELLKSL